VAGATVVLTAGVTGVATGTPYAEAAGAPGHGSLRLGVGTAKAAGGAVDVAVHPLKVVSSTGHKLRLLLHADTSGTAAQVGVGVETRDGAEEHDWTFTVPRSAVSVAADGSGRIRLSSQRSAGYATVSLRLSPQGSATHTTCQGRTATRTRHVSLSGIVLVHTKSTGKHAWGKAGSAHRTLHFSTRSKVTWTKAAASDCPTPTLACRSAFLWQVSGGPFGVINLLLSTNKGAHAQIGGIRSVPLDEPAGATRSDLVFRNSTTPNQLIVAGDGSATMQGTFRGGTATLTSPNPPVTSIVKCRSGDRTGKVKVDDWSGAEFVNGAVPIHVPAQIFGGFSMADASPADFARIRVRH
jgi:hypothetical protein